MAYERVYCRHEDKIIFKELKHILNIDDDVDAFHEIMIIAKTRITQIGMK